VDYIEIAEYRIAVGCTKVERVVVREECPGADIPLYHFAPYRMKSSARDKMDSGDPYIILHVDC